MIRVILVSLAIGAAVTGLIIGVAWVIAGGWMWGAAIRGGIVASIVGGGLYAWLREQ